MTFNFDTGEEQLELELDLTLSGDSGYYFLGPHIFYHHLNKHFQIAKAKSVPWARFIAKAIQKRHDEKFRPPTY